MIHLTLLSGWGVNARVWQPLAPHWPADCQVNTVEWPGYAEHDSAPQAHDLAALAEAMRDTLSPESIWVGWSLGGLLAACLLSHLPPPKALILLGTGPKFCQLGGVSNTELGAFQKAFERAPEATWRHFLRWQTQGEPKPGDAHRRLRDLLGSRPSADIATLRAGLGHLATLDATRILEQPPCPVQHVYGGRDHLVSPEQRKHGLLLEGVGHCPMVSQPVRLAFTLARLAKASMLNSSVPEAHS
ncbi:alpha/beta fold hydrolase [Vreelandella rituensis]|uniref:Alpha/beta fold hydrolase n=1 Tax=Vreelandella rituensis TaxID=2282306 RepID=A0A368U7T0_9GAMM|nr:alpha/beta fold hydrolase [Halomonas rituensis]RCV92546.1 alpha/beta fold hydrolase [Halomonas rituensis]